jgi:hypothetical protein
VLPGSGVLTAEDQPGRSDKYASVLGGEEPLHQGRLVSLTRTEHVYLKCTKGKNFFGSQIDSPLKSNLLESRSEHSSLADYKSIASGCAENTWMLNNVGSKA